MMEFVTLEHVTHGERFGCGIGDMGQRHEVGFGMDIIAYGLRSWRSDDFECRYAKYTDGITTYKGYHLRSISQAPSTERND